MRDAFPVECQGLFGRLVVPPERRGVGKILRPDVLHPETARQAFFMQGCITSLQEGQLVEEETDVPFSQLVVGRLADQAEAPRATALGMRVSSRCSARRC